MANAMASEMEATIEAALRSVPRDDRRDAYALSLFIHDEDDDPRRPTVTVGYNTERRWRESIAKASDSDEAKWNYAFWLQNELAVFGRGPSARVVAAWIESLGLAYTDEEAEADFERSVERDEQITRSFVPVVCEVAARLHETGSIAATFGRPVPILVHELEYYVEVADQTEAANPRGLAAEFVRWVREDEL